MQNASFHDIFSRLRFSLPDACTADAFSFRPPQERHFATDYYGLLCRRPPNLGARHTASASTTAPTYRVDYYFTRVRDDCRRYADGHARVAARQHGTSRVGRADSIIKSLSEYSRKRQARLGFSIFGAAGGHCLSPEGRREFLPAAHAAGAFPQILAGRICRYVDYRALDVEF